jgi:hypothetical protein
MSLIPQIQPPPIGNSSNSDTNYTKSLQAKTLVSLTDITDGQAIMSNGFLSNLNEPVLDKDVATMNYILSFGGGGSATGPIGAIQFNNPLGDFDGTSEFIWNGSEVVVTAVGSTITDGVSSISGGFLSNLTNPLLDTDGATKNYVDNNTSATLTEVDINIPQWGDYDYTAPQIVNKFVNKFANKTNLLALPLPIYNFPSCDQIYAELLSINPSATVGTSFNTVLKYTNNLQNVNKRVELLTSGSGYTPAPGVGITKYTSRNGVDVGVTTLKVIVDINGSGEIISAVPDPIAGGGTVYVVGDVLEISNSGIDINPRLGGTVEVTNVPTLPELGLGGVLFSPLGNLNFLVPNVSTPSVAPMWQAVTEFKYTMTDVVSATKECIGYVLTNQMIAPTNGAITDKGIISPTFTAGILIYNTVPTNYTTDGTVTYSYPNLENRLIIRGGSLTGNVSDTFDIVTTILTDGADVFAMGPGTFKFYIQNIDPTFDVILTASAGWTLDPLVSDFTIGPGKTGVFYVKIDTILETAFLFPVGIFARNG